MQEKSILFYEQGVRKWACRVNYIIKNDKAIKNNKNQETIDQNFRFIKLHSFTSRDAAAYAS